MESEFVHFKITLDIFNFRETIKCQFKKKLALLQDYFIRWLIRNTRALVDILKSRIVLSALNVPVDVIKCFEEIKLPGLLHTRARITV